MMGEENNPASVRLVITEKPSVAGTITKAIIGEAQKKKGYFEGGGYIVSWCVGHLVEPAQPEEYGEQYQKWTYESLPILPEKWKYTVKEDTKGQYEILYGLLHDGRVEEIVNACDCGREGELIFRLVYEMAGCSKPVKRLWISSMEESAIREGFRNLKPDSVYDHLYRSALCRQKPDWLVGINGTRLFTALYGGRVLKVGRVQSPTLAMLAEREMQIRNFVKEQYFTVHILCGGVEAVSGRISSRDEAEKIAEACMGGHAVVTSMETEDKTLPPPKLYDLTTLQRDANRLFGFTAKQTLSYTQRLYEKKLATYPRTDSQYLSDDMGTTAKNVIRAAIGSGLCKADAGFEPDVAGMLDSRKVTDHHAVIPTMEIAKTDLAALPETEQKILSLIANRLLCASGSRYQYQTVNTALACNGYSFKASGKSVLCNGWKDFEDAFKHSFKAAGDQDESGCAGGKQAGLPEMKEGQVFEDVQTKTSRHFTERPKHYTEDTLLSAMERAGAEDMGDDVERKGLGTPATRADIIEKLVKDGFVKREKKQILPTEDGVKLITMLPDVVKSPKLTADWENELTLVSKGEVPAQQFMSGIEDMVRNLVQTCHSVSDEQKTMFGSGAQGAGTKAALGKCPKCGGDVVKGKFGAYCKNKCGMNVSRAMGAVLTDGQIKSMLDGKKTLVKGLKGKKGSYDAYLVPEGVKEYSYTKDGKEIKGFQYKVKLEFFNKK